MMGTINNRWLLMATVVALVLVAALPLSAGPNKNKATGSVEWTNQAGDAHVYTEFALHDRDGDDVRGSHYYQEVDKPIDGVIDTWIEVEITCVVIDGDKARWTGIVADSNDDLHNGKLIKGSIQDIATPGADGDKIGSYLGYSNTPVNCTTAGFTSFPLGGTVTSGNLTVFFDDDV